MTVTEKRKRVREWEKERERVRERKSGRKRESGKPIFIVIQHVITILMFYWDKTYSKFMNTYKREKKKER